MKMKRFAALAATMVLGIQLAGISTAFASADVDGSCDFGSDNLEITLGKAGTSPSGKGDKGDVEIWIDVDGALHCDATSQNTGDDVVPADSIDSITVEMDDDDSDGSLYIYLDVDGDGTGTNADAAEWPEFGTFDIDVTTRVYVDGGGVDDDSANRLRITVDQDSVSFAGTTATSNAPSYDITGGEGSDSIDASKADARIYANGGAGDDLMKGGAGKDDLDGDTGVDVLYGNGENDSLDCGGDGTASKFEQGWGGADDDYIYDCNIVAPGTGNDDVVTGGVFTPIGTPNTTVAAGNFVALSYADVKNVEWDSSVKMTSGDAGEDTFTHLPRSFTGSPGDDVILDDGARTINGLGGDDLIKSFRTGGSTIYGGAGNDVLVDGKGEVSLFYGQSGDDILRGKIGDDSLFGGPGKDQTWGGPGSDTCGGEITNRCEFVRK